MEIKREIKTYCPKCNKHTIHTVRIPSKGPSRSLNKATRRYNRMLMGYVGKVKGAKTVKKLGKRQVVLLQCKECKFVVSRTLGSRTRKKIEISNG